MCNGKCEMTNVTCGMRNNIHWSFAMVMVFEGWNIAIKERSHIGVFWPRSPRAEGLGSAAAKMRRRCRAQPPEGAERPAGAALQDAREFVGLQTLKEN